MFMQQPFWIVCIHPGKGSIPLHVDFPSVSPLPTDLVFDLEESGIRLAIADHS
eukprot:m.158617 g.158617  ORF g.158617 m.158617 type:complete len:53 (-) comp16335_c6_seq3:97-255(-)